MLPYNIGQCLDDNLFDSIVTFSETYYEQLDVVPGKVLDEHC
jgi:hypothetical protein